jgi:hypothetical protein
MWTSRLLGNLYVAILIVCLAIAWVPQASAKTVAQLLVNFTSTGYTLTQPDYMQFVSIPTTYGIVDTVPASPNSFNVEASRAHGALESRVGPHISTTPSGYFTVYLYQSTCAASSVAADVSFPLGVCFSSPTSSFYITVSGSSSLVYTIYTYSGAGCANYVSSTSLPAIANNFCFGSFMLSYSTALPAIPGYGTISE